VIATNDRLFIRISVISTDRMPTKPGPFSFQELNSHTSSRVFLRYHMHSAGPWPMFRSSNLRSSRMMNNHPRNATLSAATFSDVYLGRYGRKNLMKWWRQPQCQCTAWNDQGHRLCQVVVRFAHIPSAQKAHVDK